jgi:N-methylhydantoinase B/oxoprolinase/acetone carboxylase alpha subunit
VPFDAAGNLIANAPYCRHRPMSESIKTAVARNAGRMPGDVYVLNDPHHGGTHLPDDGRDAGLPEGRCRTGGSRLR